MFAPGAIADVPREVHDLGASRVLVVATAGRSESASAVERALGDAGVGVFAGARQHVPVDAVDAGRAAAQRLGADALVTFGGGSTVGLGKAIALTHSATLAAIPTTYSGSEMTPIYGTTEAGVKRTGRDGRVLPRLVVYDPELTLGLPVGTSVVSAFNAMAHAVEALYAPAAPPDMLDRAEESIEVIARGLPVVLGAPSDAEARSDLLFGAHLAGWCLGASTMGLHHKLCHVLGGSFGLPHAETHTVVLPHVVRFNADAAPDAIARAGRALGAPDASRALFDLASRVRAPTSLRELGMAAEALDEAAELATRAQYVNPRPVERAPIRSLLEAAWEGRPP